MLDPFYIIIFAIAIVSYSYAISYMLIIYFCFYLSICSLTFVYLKGLISNSKWIVINNNNITENVNLS